jgi:hypothetical protein
METKYIRTARAGFVLWAACSPINHADMAAAVGPRAGQVLSAGFVLMVGNRPRCMGCSTSLDLEALPGDSEALAAQLCLPPAPLPAGAVSSSKLLSQHA